MKSIPQKMKTRKNKHDIPCPRRPNKIGTPWESVGNRLEKAGLTSVKLIGEEDSDAVYSSLLITLPLKPPNSHNAPLIYHELIFEINQQ
jgi:hypothetical protein